MEERKTKFPLRATQKALMAMAGEINELRLADNGLDEIQPEVLEDVEKNFRALYSANATAGDIEYYRRSLATIQAQLEYAADDYRTKNKVKAVPGDHVIARMTTQLENYMAYLADMADKSQTPASLLESDAIDSFLNTELNQAPDFPEKAVLSDMTEEEYAAFRGNREHSVEEMTLILKGIESPRRNSEQYYALEDSMQTLKDKMDALMTDKDTQAAAEALQTAIGDVRARITAYRDHTQVSGPGLFGKTSRAKKLLAMDKLEEKLTSLETKAKAIAAHDFLTEEDKKARQDRAAFDKLDQYRQIGALKRSSIRDHVESGFNPDSRYNVEKCYEVYTLYLYDRAKGREEKKLPLTEEENEIIQSIEAGKGFDATSADSYAGKLKEADEKDPGRPTALWFSTGCLTEEILEAISDESKWEDLCEKIAEGKTPAQIFPPKETFATGDYGPDQLQHNAMLAMANVKHMTDRSQAYFKNRHASIDETTYCRIHAYNLYRMAVQRQEDGTATEEDLKMILEPVESGRGEDLVKALKKELGGDYRNTLRPEEVDREKALLWADPDRSLDLSRQIEKDLAEKKLRGRFDEMDRQAGDLLKTVSKDNFEEKKDLASLALYQKFVNAYRSIASDMATETEKIILKAVSSGHGSDLARALMEADKGSDSPLLPDAVPGKLTFETLSSYTRAAGMNQVFQEARTKLKGRELPYGEAWDRKQNAIKEFDLDVASCKDQLRTQYYQDGKFSEAEYQDSVGNRNPDQDPSLKSHYNDMTRCIFYVFAGALYQSLPKEGRTPEQQEIADLVETGRGKDLVDALQGNPALKDLTFPTISVYHLKMVLTEKGPADLARNFTAFSFALTDAKDQLLKARRDQVLRQVYDNDQAPTPKNADHISDLAYTICAAIRYQEAMKRQNPTPASKAIVKMVTVRGLNAYADQLKKNDPTLRKLLAPGKMTKETIKMLYMKDGRKKIAGDLMEDPKKIPDGKKGPEVAGAGNPVMGK